eukprot:NODE_3536_length_658_cov_174.072250_g2524_i0.p2 GENE.NODE_3536_length_658_cov_174.072250_g2524_i0~~NODE_3536_length_658_cov_174.072250_g2524_i0.p2  ORF type:complete len:81 (-),score=7.63 NODE_3536_length_658_cov_174.072250_g2524_i0:210-452(-)
MSLPVLWPVEGSVVSCSRTLPSLPFTGPAAGDQAVDRAPSLEGPRGVCVCARLRAAKQGVASLRLSGGPVPLFSWRTTPC